MSTTLFTHITLLSLALFIPSTHSNDCLTLCTECTTSPDCEQSISIGNQCEWISDECQQAAVQIIPIPGTTSIINEDCICSAEFFSSTYNTKQSCNCDFAQSLKSISIQYTGSSTLSSVSFYHGLFLYEHCLFTNIAQNDVMTCTSFPYSQFTESITLKVTTANKVNCEAPLTTLCDPSALNTQITADCMQSELRIIGWIDDANSVCIASWNRRRRRRLLSSSSSSSSSSDGGGWMSDNTEENDGTEPLPTPYPSPSPVTAIPTVVLKEAYCECASGDSWDDYHYYDSDAELVEFGRSNLESAKSERGGNSEGTEVGDGVSSYAGARDDELVVAEDMMMTSDGWRCCCCYVECILYLSFIIFIFA